MPPKSLTEEDLLKAIAHLEELVKKDDRYDDDDPVKKDDRYDDPYGHEEPEETPAIPSGYSSRRLRYRRIDVEKPKRKRLIRINPEI